MKITPHPDRTKFELRLIAVGETLDVQFDETLFRFINPKFSTAADIVAGAGALHANGRWNLKGIAPLTYTAMTPKTALAEALEHVNYFKLPLAKALPRVLVGLRLRVQRGLDLRDGKVRNSLRLAERTITGMDWRAENRKGAETVTQAWGYAFAGAGFEAVIVPSSADRSGANVLVFPQNLLPESLFECVTSIRWPGK